MARNTENQNIKNEKTPESFPRAVQVSGVEASIESQSTLDVTFTNGNDEVKRLYEKFANNELTLQDLDEALSKTIFEDTEAKRILFLACVLNSTDEEQRNAVLTGPSSVGKTYNINETTWYFRNGDEGQIIGLSDASPRSLIHSANAITVDDRTLEPIDFSKSPKKGDPKEVWEEWHDLMRHKAQFIDLSNKIVVFYDLPNYELLKNLRSLLSHDSKICTHLITDKSNGATKTKKVLIKGYFTALFASAHSTMDEQESSRNFLLSPTDNPEKIRKAIELQARKKIDPNFKKWYETEPTRLGLKNRVCQIQKSKITNVLFKPEDMENLKQWFFQNTDCLSPKAQRDFPRLYSLAEAWALLNYMHREKTPDGTCIYANVTDIEVAKKIYEPILKCNELGLTPEEFEVWKIIEPHTDPDMGLRIAEIHNIYYNEKKRHCSDKRLREMLKNFACAGLLKEEKEGPVLKYYAITHKQTKQVELAKSEDNSTTQLYANCESPITNESYSGLCGKCEQEAMDAASKQSTGAAQ